MKKATPFSKKLKSYSLLSGSIVVSVAVSNAQVVYTDLEPDGYVQGDDYGNPSIFELDLDNNGIVDFEISAENTFYNICYARSSVLIDSEYPNAHALNLNQGDAIDSELPWDIFGEFLAFHLWQTSPCGVSVESSISNLQSEFIGLRFNIDGNKHYGWVRLLVGWKEAVIYDYAYQGTPNIPILAGDTGCSTLTTYYADSDNDGFGISNNVIEACIQPSGYVTNSADCNDSIAVVNPAAIEICDGIDNNCDGSIDPLSTFYADADNDGYGNNNITIIDCISPAGYVTDNTDCDDSNALVNPSAIETCDNIDNNCDGNIDEGLLLTFYADADGDFYGNADNSTLACALPNGYVADNTDCDDNNALVNASSSEICNGVDDNCNASIDEGFPSVIYYADSDNDGFGNPNNIVDSCAQPIGFITDSTDCDDTDANVNPGAAEILFNGIDDDCDGYIDEFGTDIYSSPNPASVFSLFPNPTNGEFVVNLQLQNKLNAEAKIEVINLLGQVVLSKTNALLKGKLESVIKLDDVADGPYLVRGMVNAQVYISPIIFQY